MTQSVRPAGAPWLSPYITVKDVSKALEFYKKAFNFHVKDTSTGTDGNIVYAEMTY